LINRTISGGFASFAKPTTPLLFLRLVLQLLQTVAPLLDIAQMFKHHRAALLAPRVNASIFLCKNENIRVFGLYVSVAFRQSTKKYFYVAALFAIQTLNAVFFVVHDSGNL
jgi:hypothetical protein